MCRHRYNDGGATASSGRRHYRDTDIVVIDELTNRRRRRRRGRTRTRYLPIRLTPSDLSYPGVIASRQRRRRRSSI